jgi:hypothetical protein
MKALNLRNITFTSIALLFSGQAAYAAPPAPNSLSFTSFDVPGADPDGYFVTGVNDTGVVVGSITTNSGAGYAGFIRSPTGQITAPVLVPNDNEVATGPYRINDAGVIAGTYGIATHHGFLLVNGQFTTWDFPGAAATALRGLSNFGALAGNIDDGSGTFLKGFIAPRRGAPITFTHPDPTTTDFVVEAINARGAVSGRYVPADGIVRGFLRTPDGGFVDVVVPGSDSTAVYGLNDCGVTVGVYTVGGPGRGFYGRPGHLVQFDLPGVLATRPRGISDNGRIAGDYRDVNGVVHGFVTRIAQASCDR